MPGSQSQSIVLEDGKYTITNDNGILSLLRNGEAWPAGDEAFATSGLVLALVHEVERLHELHAARSEVGKPDSVILDLGLRLEGPGVWKGDDLRLQVERLQGWIQDCLNCNVNNIAASAWGAKPAAGADQVIHPLQQGPMDVSVSVRLAGPGVFDSDSPEELKARLQRWMQSCLNCNTNHIAADVSVHAMRTLAEVQPAVEQTERTREEDSAVATVPGVGYLWDVPITVDTTKTGSFKVRAKTRREAINLARELAFANPDKLEVDEGNYRGACDHYCGDPAALEAEPVGASGGFPPAVVDDPDSDADAVAQAGAYVVEVLVKGELMELRVMVFDDGVEDRDFFHAAAHESRAAALTTECSAFCLQIATALHEAVPDPTNVSDATIEQAVTRLAEGFLVAEVATDYRNAALQEAALERQRG